MKVPFQFTKESSVILLWIRASRRKKLCGKVWQQESHINIHQQLQTFSSLHSCEVFALHCQTTVCSVGGWLRLVWNPQRKYPKEKERERVLSSHSSKVRWSYARQAGAVPESHAKSQTQKMALKCTALKLCKPSLFVFFHCRFQSCHFDWRDWQVCDWMLQHVTTFSAERDNQRCSGNNYWTSGWCGLMIDVDGCPL